MELACDVVRQTHEEASLSIAMLREEWPAGKELGSALEDCAASIVAGGMCESFAKDAERAGVRRRTYRFE
jgi:hypothetical protein